MLAGSAAVVPGGWGREIAVMDWPQLESLVAGLSVDARVLEVGTGQGALLGHLLSLLGGGSWRLVTIDVAPHAIAAAEARLRAAAAAVRERVVVKQADVLDFAATPANQGDFAVVVASALLSAVPLTRAWSLNDVLASLAKLVGPDGILLLEDYLPLAPAIAACATGNDHVDGLCAARAAREIWRWYKAVAELDGAPHYEEVPPSWVRTRLLEHGFRAVEVSTDDRQVPRGRDDLRLLAAEQLARPESIDQALWFALDRYRRDRLRVLVDAGGLVQWSGWYRICATR
jgi:SAM-dependent methyltransferase